jgi:hypothetical protein
MTQVILIAFALSLAAATRAEADDPVAACRAAHAGDAASHIACLEEALRDRGQPASQKAAGLGAEQVRAAERRTDPEAESKVVRVVSITYDAEGRGIFRTESGEVWHETEVSPVSKRLDPQQDYSARIEPGRLSGYRMYVDGIRRMIKVRRVR